MQCDAAGELAFILGQQQAAFGRSIATWEIGEFSVEVLKSEAEAEGLGVFDEEFAGLGELGWGFCLSKR
jgi:hypothetical protein